jgi:membrane-bound ClpP family serine protease
MTWILLLFSLGICLIAVEVIIPGGIIGTIGGLMMFAGCVLSFLEFGTLGGMLSVCAAILMSAIALFIEFRVLPKTRIGKRAFLTSEISGVSAAFGHEALALVGKSAEALTMLSPSGYVMIDGIRYEAFCESGQAPAGSALRVTGADNFRLIVSLSNPN